MTFVCEHWLDSLSGEPANTRALAGWLADHVDEDAQIAISQDFVRRTVAMALGLRSREAYRAFESLLNRRWVVQVQAPDRENWKPAVYRLIVPSVAPVPVDQVPRYRLNTQGDLERVNAYAAGCDDSAAA